MIPDRLLDDANEEGRVEALQLIVRLGRRGEGHALPLTIARLAGVVAAAAQSAVLLTELPGCPVSAEEILAGLREHFDESATKARAKVRRTVQ